MSTWHASISFTTKNEFTEDAPFDLMDTLLAYGVSMTTSRDFRGGSILLTIEADTAIEAADKTITLLRDNAPATIGEVEIVGIEVLTPEALDVELSRPTFPEVVGFAEIAKMGGFDRSRARQLSVNDTFPEPVIKTAQGPLYSKHAISAYLKTRNTRPGRPIKATA